MAERSRGLRQWAAAALFAVAGLVVALAGAMTTGDWRGQGVGSPGLSLATVTTGAKAAYLLLERLGHPVERLAQMNRGYRKAKLAFLLAPTEPPEAVDRKALHDWVEAGGVLVFGVDAFRVDVTAALTEALELPGLLVQPTSERQLSLTKDWMPARWLSVHAIVKPKPGENPGDDTADDGVLADDHGEPGAWQFGKGRGKIYLLDARVFSNAGLKQADNALFLAALAARHGGGQPIVFDELVHGLGNSASVMQIAPWTLRWALGVGAFALLCWALAVGRRLGPPSPLPRPPRRASYEQIETLATYWAGQHDRGPALAALAAWAGVPAPPAPPDDAGLVQAARPLTTGKAAKDATKGTRWP